MVLYLVRWRFRSLSPAAPVGLYRGMCAGGVLFDPTAEQLFGEVELLGDSPDRLFGVEDQARGGPPRSIDVVIPGKIEPDPR